MSASHLGGLENPGLAVRSREKPGKLGAVAAGARNGARSGPVARGFQWLADASPEVVQTGATQSLDGWQITGRRVFRQFQEGGRQQRIHRIGLGPGKQVVGGLLGLCLRAQATQSSEELDD